MLRRLSRRLTYANVMSTIAVFGVLAGGTAYAADTIGGGDIIDNAVSSADVRDDNLGFGGLAAQDLSAGSVRSSEVLDDSLTNVDIKNFSLGNGDFITGSVDSRAVTDNSLTGADIDESTLNMPPTTTATFAGVGRVILNDSFTKVAGKALFAGSYAVTATANIESPFPFAGDIVTDTVCELRNGNSYIGGAKDRRTTHDRQHTNVSLSMNGGAQVPTGGGEVSLWCRYQGGGGAVNDAQMMMIRLDGFS